MKLCTFEVKTPVGPFHRLGAVTIESGQTRYLDLNFTLAAKLAGEGTGRAQAMADALIPPEMIAFGAAGPQALKAAGEALAFAASAPEASGPRGEKLLYRPGEARLLSPVLRPPLIRGFTAFESHITHAYAKVGLTVPEVFYENPLCFKSSGAHMVGPDEEVPWPSYTEKMDFELEFCVVIGRGGRDIPEERAREHILGFSILNDWSARDAQIPEMKMGTGPFKGKDFCWGMGPWIATPDEVDDYTQITMSASVNGEKWAEVKPEKMLWSFEQIISYTSRDEWIQPGDLMGTGTVPGGSGIEIDRWVKPGDLVELDMGPMGVLRNRIGPRPEKRPISYR